MKIVLECDDVVDITGAHTVRGPRVEIDNDAVDIYDVLENLVRPALIAVGYHPDTVNRAIPDCDECDAERYNRVGCGCEAAKEKDDGPDI